jgi:hypothetical protein
MSPLFLIHEEKTKDKQKRNRGGEIQRRRPPQTKRKKKKKDMVTSMKKARQGDSADGMGGSLKESDYRI